MAVAPKEKSSEILRKFIPLNTLKDDAIKKVLEIAEFAKLAKGDFLFREGETDNFNVYLLSGEVGLFSGDKEMDSVSAGSDTARFPLAHQIPRKFSVKAKTKVEIVCIDNRVLGELLAKAGGAAYEVSDFDAEETDDWMSQLLKYRVFQLIPASNIQGVMMRMEEVEAKAGDVIIRQGEEGDYFYLINKGRCSVLFTEAEGGEANEVAQLGPGDSFGEESLLSNKPRGSTVIMINDGVLLRLSKDDFVQYVKTPLAKTTNYAQGEKQVDQGGVWLDVRSAEAFEERHLHGSINLPFSSLRYQASNLDPDNAYIVYCDDGQLSTTAAYLLVEQGFDITILDRGLKGVPDSVWAAEPEDNVVALRPGDEGTVADSQELVKKLAEAEGRSQQLEQMKKMKLAFDKAKARIAALEEEKQDAIGQQAHQLKDLQDEIAKKDGRLEYVEEQLGKLKELGETLGEKEKALAETEKLLAQLQEQGARKDQAAQAQQQQLSSIEKSLHDAMTERDQATGKLNKLEGRSEEIEKAHKAAEERVAELEQQLKSQAADSEQAKTDLDAQHQQALKAAEESLEQERAAHQEALKKAETLEKASGESESQHAEALAALQKSLDEESAKKGEAEQKLEALQAERDQLQSEMDQAKAGAEELTSKLAALEQTGGESETKHAEALAALQKSLEEEGAKRSEAEQKAESLQGELATAGEKAAELESRLSEGEKGLEEQRTKLEQEHEQVAEAQQKLQELESDKNRLQDELDEAVNKVSELEAGRVAQEEASVAQQADHEQVLGELREELKKAVAESEGVQEKLKNAENRIGELEQTLAAKAGSEEEAAQWQTQIETLKSQLEQEQENLQQANDKSKELEDELRAAQGQAEKLGEVESQLAERDAQVKELQEANEKAKDLEVELSAVREQAAKLDELESQLAERDTQIQELQEAGERLASTGEELDVLRKELQEAVTGREAAEKKVEDTTRQLAELSSGGDEVKVLQGELDSLTVALEESDQAHEEAEKRVAQLESEQEELKKAAEALPEGAAEETEAALEEERNKRQDAETEVERLNGEVAELRDVMEQYVEQINQAKEGVEGEDVESLRTELQLVRDMADADLKQLREELEEARRQLSEQGGAGEGSEDVNLLKAQLKEAENKLQQMAAGGSADVAENEALRQEGDSLRRSVEEREQQISSLQRDLRKLEERIEDSNGEVDRLKQALEMSQVDAEEAEFRSSESEQARKQVEEALYTLQQQVESERPIDADSKAIRVKKPLDMSAESGGKGNMVGIAIGAVVAFVLAEGLSIISGKGELISGLFAEKAEVEVAKPEPVTPTLTPTAEPSREIAQQPVSEPVKEPEPQPEPEPVTAPPPKPEPVVAQEPPPPPKPAQPAMGAKLRDTLRSGGSGPEMLYMRGGKFTMGSDRSQLAAEERPAHSVAVGDFAIGRYEVTFDDYKRFAQATGNKLPDDLGWGQGSRPVINVSWDDAQAYTKWLSQQTGERYRLPTEAEWEYAANAGSDSLYWWGYQLSKNKANCFNCGSRWDGVSTAPAGSFSPNKFGLYSTAGNVMEWVEDCYHYGYDGAPTDGSAWVERGCRERVVKGGAFNKSGDSLRTTKRTPHEADAKLFVLGFRVARDVE